MPHEELPSLQRPRYGCKCAGRAGFPPPLGSPLPNERVGEAEGAGCAPRREREVSSCVAAKLGAGELELQRAVVSDLLPPSPQISDPQLATPTLYPANLIGARQPRWVCALGQTRLGV